MESNKKISVAVIKRLPIYLRYLDELMRNEVIRISSKELSEKMGVTASQIRQDLNNFGGFGQQGYGYNVEYLHSEISKILGLEKSYNAIIVGAGNLGQALANYWEFEKRGFIIKGLFDVKEDILGKTIRDTSVRHFDDVESFIKKENIELAILTIPKTEASRVAQKLVSYGIKGIWNFTQVDLKIEDKEVAVENVNLSDSLFILAYNLNN